MKKVTLKILLIILLIVLLVSITGCSNNNDSETKEQLDSNSEEQSVVDDDKITLNPELSNIVSVALKEEIDETNRTYSVYALDKDGNEIELLSKNTTYKYAYVNKIDYMAGKIYLVQNDSSNEKTIIYSIDLTLGDGNYTEEKVVSIKDMYIYDFSVFDNGKIYITSDNNSVESYDLGNGEFKTIDSAEKTPITTLKTVKENKNIAFVIKNTKDGVYTLKNYNVETENLMTIVTGDISTDNYSYTYPLYIMGMNDTYILYSNSNDEDGISHLYNIKTNDDKELPAIVGSCVFVGDEIFLDQYQEGNDGYPPERISIYKNGEVIGLVEYTDGYSNYDEIYDLGTGKIQTRLSWGQDISTSGEQFYTIDIETYNVEEVENGYQSVHILKDFENKKISLQEKEIEKISIEEAEEIVKEKWGLGVISGEDDDEYTIDNISGAYKNCTVFDKDGMEYYVFSYSANLGTHTSHVQTVFLSVDGKKYKITATGDDFSDGDVLQEFGIGLDDDPLEGEI